MGYRWRLAEGGGAEPKETADYDQSDERGWQGQETITHAQRTELGDILFYCVGPAPS